MKNIIMYSRFSLELIITNNVHTIITNKPTTLWLWLGSTLIDKMHQVHWLKIKFGFPQTGKGSPNFFEIDCNYEHSTVVFWYEISQKFSASNLNYSQIGSSLSFKTVERVRNILNSFA